MTRNERETAFQQECQTNYNTARMANKHEDELSALRQQLESAQKRLAELEKLRHEAFEQGVCVGTSSVHEDGKDKDIQCLIAERDAAQKRVAELEEAMQWRRDRTEGRSQSVDLLMGTRCRVRLLVRRGPPSIMGGA